MLIIAEREGRLAFGHNPMGYDAVRPPYPEAVFAVLREQGALFPGATTLEIGAGNGLATRRLPVPIALTLDRHGVTCAFEPRKLLPQLLSGDMLDG